MPYTFEIHHIFQLNAIDDPDVKNALINAGFNFELRGNKIALFNDPDTATKYGFQRDCCIILSRLKRAIKAARLRTPIIKFQPCRIV